MPVLTLTDDAIEAKRKNLEGREVEWWDDQERGLYVRFKPPSDKHAKGTASFRFQYRFNDATKRLTIGQWPSWSVDEARTKAKAHRVSIKDGVDPGGNERRRRTDGITLADAIKKWVGKMESKWSGKTGGEVKRIFGIDAKPGATVYIPPAFAKRQLADIDKQDIIGLIDKLSDPDICGPVMANRVLAWLRALFRFYLDRGKITLDPTAGLKKNTEAAKERDLSDDELRRVWRATDKLSAPMAAYLRLLILTGQRRSEVAGIRATMIDRGDKLWTMPASHYKTKVANVVPFGSEAWGIVEPLLKAADKANADHLLRSGSADVAINSFTKIKRAIDKAIAADGEGPMQSWGFHDLRRTLRGGMSKLGIPGEIAERCLGHVVSGIEGVYNKYDFIAQKRQAFDRWASHVIGLTDPAATDKVRQLRA